MSNWWDNDPIQNSKTEFWSNDAVVKVKPKDGGGAINSIKNYANAGSSAIGQGIGSIESGAGTFLQAPAANTLAAVKAIPAVVDRGMTNLINAFSPGEAVLYDPAQKEAQMASAFAAEAREKNANTKHNLVAWLGKAMEEDGRELNKRIEADDRVTNPELIRQQEELSKAEGFVDNVAAVAKNPMAFTHTLVKSVPDMALGLGAGRIAAGRVLATEVAAGEAAAARIAAAGGDVVAQQSAAKLAAQAVRDKAVTAASTAGMLSEGASSANSSRESTYTQIVGMPFEKLVESPRFNELLKQTDSKEKAREILANEVADQTPIFSGALTAAGTLATNKAFGGDATAKVLAGVDKASIKAVAKDAAQEGIEEVFQGVPQGFSDHQAMQIADPNKKFDLGGEISQNAMGGFAMGAGGHGGAYAFQKAGELKSIVDAKRSDAALPQSAQTDVSPAQNGKPSAAEAALMKPQNISALDRVGEIDIELGNVQQRLSSMTPEGGYGQAFDQERAELTEQIDVLKQERGDITQSWPKAAPGLATSFTTEAGIRLEAQYALMEAGELQTSHDENLRANPAYPPELQPRERDRAASATQISGIVSKLDPARLGLSADAATGAPIVGADGLVESGNARTIALKRVYQANGQKAEDYKTFLTENAAQFGIDPAHIMGMQKPVLVRVRATPVNRAEFARQANASTVARMSPVEQARSDAARLDVLDDLNPDDNGDFTTSRDFIRRFMAKVPQTEVGEMIDGDGKLSPSGYARMRNAVLAKAYGDSPVILRMTESLDDNLRNVSKALMQVAPQVAKVRASIYEGHLHDADITPDLLGAVEELSRIKDKGKTVKDYLAQAGMFGDTLTPEGNEMLQFLDENIRRPRQMAEFILRYTEALEAMGNPNQADIFGDNTAPTKGELLTAAKREHHATQESIAGEGGSQEGEIPAGSADFQRIDASSNAQSDQSNVEDPGRQTEQLAAPEVADGWASFGANSGTLGIPRAEMPQIKAEHRGAMVNFLKARDIASNQETVNAESLKPTQAEFSLEKVEKAKAYEGGERSILISSDNHVLDGHHQWMAKKALGEEVKVIRLDAPIAKLLDTVKEFPSVETSEESAKATVTPIEQARADMLDALDDLGAIARKVSGARMIKEEDYPDLLPTLVKLFGAAFKIAGHDMKKASAHVRNALKEYPALKKILNFIRPETMQKAAEQAFSEIDTTNLNQPSLFDAPKSEATPGTKEAQAAITKAELDKLFLPDMTNEQLLRAREIYTVGKRPEKILVEMKKRGMGEEKPKEATNLVSEQNPELKPESEPIAEVATEKEVVPDAKKAEPIRSEAPSKPSERIDDFGEKIGGARKDVWSGFKDKINGLRDVDVASEPLSKSWPEPDYNKMLEAGADSWAVAFMHAARDAVPRKPSIGYKLRHWTSQTTVLRDTMIALTNGEISVVAAKELLKKAAERSFNMEDISGRIDLYEAVGHSKSLAELRVTAGAYSVFNGVEYKPSRIVWMVEKKSSAPQFGNWPNQVTSGATKEELISNFKAKFSELETVKPGIKETSFDVYSTQGQSGFKVGKKVGRNFIELAGPFATVKEAREYKTDNQEALVAKLEKVKEIPSERRASNEPRVGEDMRNGQDVTPEMFSKTFGFRGVEFGNYVEQSKRQADLNESFDALMDMAAVLGIPAKSLSLNGQLAMAFGARGKGAATSVIAAAHYEPDTVVINLTKKSGAGSLGHEWWHALDNYFSRMRGNNNDMMSDALDVSLSSRGSNYVKRGEVRKEMIDAYGAVMKSIRQTALKARSDKLDSKRTKGYWTLGHEMTARAFESYLISKLQDQNASNDYLANIISEEAWAVAEKVGFELDASYPYPTAGEVPVIRAGFDHFFNTIESKETDDGVALFKSGNGQNSFIFGMPVDEVKSHVDTLAKTWKNAPNITAVQSASDLPFAAPYDARGAYYQGKVWLVADNLHSETDVQMVLFHETLGHAGLRGALGDNLAPALRDIAARNQSVAKAAANWRKKNADIRGSRSEDKWNTVSIEEALAEMTESGVQITSLQKFISKVQAALRAVGLHSVADWMENATQAEVMALLSQARQHIQKGDTAYVFGHVEAAAFSTPESEEQKLSREEARKSISTEVGKGFRELVKQSGEAFQFAKLKGDKDLQKSLNQTEIAFTVGSAKPGREKVRSSATEQFVITNTVGEHAYVYRFGKDVQLDVSGLKSERSRGTAVYQAVASWAHANDYIFEGDSAGISEAGIMRRTENMISTILRHGDSYHVKPHPDQAKALNIRWSTGDSDFNLGELLIASYNQIKGNLPEIDHVTPTEFGDFISKTGSSDEGQLFAGDDFGRIAKKYAGAELHRVGGKEEKTRPVGERTIKRAAITGALFAGAIRRYESGLHADSNGSGNRSAPGGIGPGVVYQALYSRGVDPAKTTAERAEDIIQTSAATMAPVDKLVKGATQLLKIDKATTAIYNGAAFILDRYTPETIKAGFVSDYGVPQAVIDRRAGLSGHMNVQTRKAGKLIDKLASLTREESRVAYEWMNNSDPQALKYFEDQLPAESVKVLAEVKKMVDALSKEAVALGQLSQDAYDANQMEYLRRSYQKHTLELDKRESTKRTRAISILGDQYKGRGLSESAPMTKMLNTVPDWWGRKLKAGTADKQLKGEKFIRLERHAHSGEGTVPMDGIGDRSRGQLQEVIYYPEGETIPKQYAEWSRAGTFEVKDTKGGDVILWRDFSKEEREKMGEIDEARFAIAKTLHGMIHDVEVGRYLEWIGKKYSITNENQVPGGVVEAKELGLGTIGAVYKKDDWVQIPDTKVQGTNAFKYGKLAGKYVPGPIWNDIRQINSGSFKPLGDVYSTILKAWKMSKTALSPAVHMNNVMANMVMADWHDVSAGHIAKSLRILMAASDREGTGLIGSAQNIASRAGIPDREAAKEIIVRYQDSGGSIGTWASAELQRDQIQPLLDALEKELATNPDSVAAQVGVMNAVQFLLRGEMSAAFDAAKGSKSGKAVIIEGQNLIDLYQSEDEVFRLAAWLKAKEGGDTDMQAGHVSRKSFLDYNINAPWVAMLRATAFPFAAFSYRAIPMMAETVAKRPWKVMKLAMLGGMLNALGYMLSGGDEDDERRYLPEEKAGRVWGMVPKLVRMPWNDSHNQPVFLDVRRFIPVGDIFDTGANNAAIPMLPALMPGGPLMLVAEVMLDSSGFTGKKISLETDTAMEKYGKTADYLYKSMMPNLVMLPGTHAWDNVMKASTGGTDSFGRELSTGQALLNTVGLKVGSYGADTLRMNAAKKLQGEMMEIDHNINKVKREYARKGMTYDQFITKVRVQQEKKAKLAGEFRRK